MFPYESGSRHLTDSGGWTCSYSDDLCLLFLVTISGQLTSWGTSRVRLVCPPYTLSKVPLSDRTVNVVSRGSVGRFKHRLVTVWGIVEPRLSLERCEVTRADILPDVVVGVT